MHNAAYQAMGLDLVYLAAHVPAQELATALQGLWTLGALGLNLTIPHKQRALALCKELTPAAAFVGAVNTLRRGPEGWHGENTDAGGWLDSWQEEMGVPLRGRKAIVLGAGGASKAVLFALREAEIGTVVVLNRSVERADGPLTRLPDELEEGCVVINTTSVGLQGDESAAVWPDRLPACYVCDLIYRPTRFLREAAERGAVTMGGLGMLLHQAARAIRFWTGEAPPVEVMRAALVRV